MKVLRDTSSASSVALGEVAVGSESLSIAFGSSEPLDEDRWELSWAGLQHVIQRIRIKESDI